ncbi:hypothetical protein [Enterococcus mundtii]|uniref:Uncharacterized protein n=2 Tax=Enterococcus mundtii TaxID=53346 RepID=A0ABQ0VDN7_ENTMU|nr:hypothetical protein [Enterococcus mundtii]GEN17868.1 hypothetical protein LAC02_11490 [Ligilactobacillus acidipiscis]MDB7086176.1 hypothetical protein [Enterococcus mundtii]MZZ59152.1 hypothetical protein [Enterococcus mundtii]MZZ62150.1 hypothetical protein [Enterococcus mundtii]MZZ69230.1 hypothetical protein [Enterococcus mundtii]
MLIKIMKFADDHPYLIVIYSGLFGSAFGITIEYIVNRDFLPSGIYSLMFYYVIELSIVKLKSKK